ncbi:hypothetical protein B7463_g7726, partial [Scytalidium lignicola]
MSDISPQSFDASSSTGTPPPDGNAGQFVPWKPEDAPTRKASARLYHKKSRNGCQHCRARRVKVRFNISVVCFPPPSSSFGHYTCDEVHPTCGSCQRHQVTCVYGRPIPNRNSEHPDINKRPEANNQTNSGFIDLPGETPEARHRRILELKLLYQYMTETGRSICLPSSKSTSQMVREVWVTGIPRLGFQNDSLLYSMYSVAALHLANTEPQNIEMIEASSTYLGLAIRTHRDEVIQLKKDNADAVCLTSSIIRVCAFAMLHERDLQPYTAPTQWLLMTNEAGSVFMEAWGLIADDPTSLTRVMITNSSEITGNGAVFRGTKPWELEATFGETNRQGFTYLLQRSKNNIENEPWNPEIQAAYETTVSFIGGVRLAIDAKRNAGDILRSLVLFPMLIQRRFIDLVRYEQPRALVVLAHYFALLARFGGFWWIGDAGRREVQGIHSVLPVEWQDLLNWPLETIEAEPILVLEHGGGRES